MGLTLLTSSSPPVRRELTPLRLIFHGTIWNGLAVIVARFSPGILTVVLARWLEPAALGSVSFVLAYYAVLSLVADWSIAYAVQKLVPENPDRVGEVSWTALSLRLSFSLLLGILCWILDLWAGVFHGYGSILAIVLVASAFSTIVFIQNAACKFMAGALLSMAFQVVWVALALILVKMGMPIRGPLLALPIAFFGIGVPTFLLSRAITRPIRLSMSVARQILKFGSWATLATLLSGFTDQVGVLVIAYKSGDTAAAIFKVAATFGVVPALLGIVVITPLMPVAKQTLLEGEDVSSTLVQPILGYLLMLGLPVAILGLILAPAVISTFVRESYLSAVWPLRILLCASLLRMVVTAFSGILFVAHGTKELVKIHGTVAFISFAGSVISPGKVGAAGVASALLLGWLAGAMLLQRWLRAQGSLHLEWRRYLRYGTASGVVSVFLVVLSRALHPAWMQLVIGGSLALTAYALLLWLQRDAGMLRLFGALAERVSI